MLTVYKPQRNSVEHFLSSFFNDTWTNSPSIDFTPKTDIKEEDNQYVIHMDIPGLGKEDVKIEVEDNQLIVSGERKSSKEENKDGWLRCERHYGKFSRAFNLGSNVDQGKITADFKNGELTLSLPKAEKAQKKLISIN